MTRMISLRPSTAPGGASSPTRRRRHGVLSAGWPRSLLVGLLVGLAVAVYIWFNPFDRGTRVHEKFTASPALASFFGPALRAEQHGSFGLDRIEVVRSADTPFAYYARVTYPARSSSVRASVTSDGIVVGGTQLYLASSQGPTDHAFLRYYVRFPAGFDFVKGGKLPGLYGGTVTSGRRIPDGANGLSTRYMWRAAGAGEVYAYLPTSKEHGTSLGRGDWHWPTDQWACVEQEVRLNDPGHTNGSVNVWLDDHQVLAQRGLTFRNTDSLKIAGLFFSTFFGGGDASWATPIQQHADFAAFDISARRIGCDAP